MSAAEHSNSLSARARLRQWRTPLLPPTSNRKPPARIPEQKLSLTITFAYLDQKADPWRNSLYSHHTRTQHANSPTRSSNAEASNDPPYTLGLYQSSSSDSESSTVRERPTSSPQHYSRRRHRSHQCRPSSSRKRRHQKHP